MSERTGPRKRLPRVDGSTPTTAGLVVGLAHGTLGYGRRADLSLHVLERGRRLGTGPQMPDPPARPA